MTHSHSLSRFPVDPPGHAPPAPKRPFTTAEIDQFHAAHVPPHVFIPRSDQSGKCAFEFNIIRTLIAPCALTAAHSPPHVTETGP